MRTDRQTTKSVYSFLIFQTFGIWTLDRRTEATTKNVNYDCLNFFQADCSCTSLLNCSTTTQMHHEWGLHIATGCLICGTKNGGNIFEKFNDFKQILVPKLEN